MKRLPTSFLIPKILVLILIIVLPLVHFAFQFGFLPTVKANPDSGTWQVGASSDDVNVADPDDSNHPPWSELSFIVAIVDLGAWYNEGPEYWIYEGEGFRFNSITIPKDATILSAYVQLCAYNDMSGTTANWRLATEDSDNATTFSTLADYNGRSRTSYVAWSNVGSWTAGTWYDSPNISSCIQTVVNRAGWVSGNSLVVFCEDDGTSTASRRLYTYHYNSTVAPKLYVEWTVGVPEYDYVDNNTSDVDSSEDKGTHSDFDAEKAGPDSTFDTLTEENTGGASGDWWNTDFLYRKKITFDNSAISENLANFPMPIVFSSNQATFWSHVNRTTGSDVRFVDADNTTELYFEVELFDTTNNASVWWVKVPQIDSESTTDFVWLYYGNSTCGFDAYNDMTQVWETNYCGVWHLNSLTGADSTGKSANTTASGTPTVVAGKFNSAIDFGTTAQTFAINLGTDSDIDFSDDNTFTVEFWIFYDVTGVDQMCFHQSQGSSSWNIAFGTYDADVINNDMKFIHRDDDGTGRDTLNASMTFNAWVYVVGTYNNDGSDYKALYLNGALATSTTSGINNSRAGPATATQIGYGGDFGAMDGKMDEVRLSTNVRSAEWVEACYQYQVDQSKFTYAAEEDQPNFELDLEIQWTDANYTRTNEQLCIYAGAFNSSENIQVKVWNGASWNWIINLTASQWNNVTVSSYLTSGTFTVQFLGGTETSDTECSTWQIDCALLHTWDAAFTAELTIVTTSHSWSITPGQSDILINEGTIDITVTANQNFNVQVKGSGDLAWTSYTIALSNVQVHKDTLGSAIPLTTDYQNVPDLTNQASGTGINISFKLWLTCPTGKPAGTYTYTLSIKIVQYT